MSDERTVRPPAPDSAPVTVTNDEPIAVTVAGETQAHTTARTVAAKASADADVLTNYGQRRINLIWEATQSVIALLVTATTLYVAATLAVSGKADAAAFLLLSNAFFLVVGFYFGRTNHTRVGGVGPLEGR